MANRKLDVEDSYVIMHNLVQFDGNLDKNHLGSSGKGGYILYLILRDVHKLAIPVVLAHSGANGSLINVAQMVVCIGQLAINNHRAIYHFQKTCKFF